MTSFPQMQDIPPVLDSTGWTWERYSPPSIYHSKIFWLGVDREGNRWLTKLRGSFCAYREIVFARLAQRMGWSCQSSSFLRLDMISAKRLSVPATEVQAVHWFMDEHIFSPCSLECSVGRTIEILDDLYNSGIKHHLDLAKSDIAACLFGANEPSGRFISTAHDFVIIDSEQMFSTGPCELDGTAWWKHQDGSQSPAGQALALEVCLSLCAISTEDLYNALSIPKTISIQERWPIRPKLLASKEFAIQFLNLTKNRTN